jgi:transcriptional regulator GlxA family with amidase domain
MHVGVVAVPACWDSGLVTMLDVLRGANTARVAVDRDIPEIRISTVGLDCAPVRTAGGLLVPVDLTMDEAGSSSLDLLVVPALAVNTSAGIVDAMVRDDVRAIRGAIREWAQAGRPLAAACTGTFVLADAGLLDSRQATTSWWLVDDFRRRYPRVALDMSRMVVADGPIVTAGAAFAHIDLAMHIVAGLSPQLADATAALLLFDQRPARSADAAHTYLASTDPLVIDFEAWIRANLGRDISVAEAAFAIGTTRRTLERRVRDQLGLSPYALVQRLRVERAHHLKQTTSLSLDQIAPMVGYRNASALRKPLKALRRDIVNPPEESLH